MCERSFGDQFGQERRCGRAGRARCRLCPDVDRPPEVFDREPAGRHPQLTEHARIVQLLVARITVSEAGLAIDLRHDGLGAIAALKAPPNKEVA